MVYSLDPGARCQVSSLEDIKVEYLSQNLGSIYYRYEKNAAGICTAVGTQKNYFSGETLLTDYDKVCGHYIEIQNSGTTAQKFVVFYKNSLLAYSLSVCLLLVSIIGVLLI